MMKDEEERHEEGSHESQGPEPVVHDGMLVGLEVARIDGLRRPGLDLSPSRQRRTHASIRYRVLH